MKTLLLLLLLAASTASADLAEARALLARNEPAKAAELLRSLLAEKPGDPWLLYNQGVAAYAAKEFAMADETWQALAAAPLPDDLREHVWAQVGNVSYRLVQPSIEPEPDVALPRLEQAREAYRIALAFNKRHATAKQNLPVIEKELEKVYARLARRLVEEAKKEWNVERAIEKLEAALSHQRNAQAINPKDPELQQAMKEIEKALSEKYTQKAADEEKRADNRTARNEWERKAKVEDLQAALTDFQQAENFDAQNQPAKDGEKRVQEKLADFLAKLGREEQKEAVSEMKYQPEEAVASFEQALEHFEEALAMKPDHADAQKGEAEVKEQLAQLRLQQGDQQAKQGEQDIARQPELAAQELTSALDHFEQAQQLQPDNGEIPPRIEKVQAMLPELLVQLGQKEQQAASQAEPRSTEQAVAHLEKAETSFDRAQELAPENGEAKEGQQQVQEALARLRQQLAQKAEQGQQPGHEPPKQPGESFEAMLSKFKPLKEQQRVNARPNRGEKYQQEREKGFRNW